MYPKLFLKVLENIDRAQAKQQKNYEQRKRKNVLTCTVNVGEEVLISKNPMTKKEGLASHHDGPYVVTNISAKGVATVKTGNNSRKQLNVKRLRPYHRLESKVPISLLTCCSCYDPANTRSTGTLLLNSLKTCLVCRS